MVPNAAACRSILDLLVGTCGKAGSILPMANHDGEPLASRDRNGLQLFVSLLAGGMDPPPLVCAPRAETRQKGHMRTHQRSISALGSLGDFGSGGAGDAPGEGQPGGSIAKTPGCGQRRFVTCQGS
jgi:hypothetical protein